MSHYAVAVFAHDGDFVRLLTPYNENNKDEFVFVVIPYEKIVEDFEVFKKENPSYTLNTYIKAYGYVQHDGNWGYWHNPHGFWDWYSLDGKDYLFDPKPGVYLSEDERDYRKNDIEWFPEDKEAKADAEEFWDSFIGENAFAEPPGLFNRRYFLERYKTKEQYVKEMQRTVPWAFITPDGEWHSAGTVGWFACSDEDADSADRYYAEWEAYINSDDNPYVNLVDCHI
jgi:hypothetical protein